MGFMPGNLEMASRECPSASRSQILAPISGVKVVRRPTVLPPCLIEVVELLPIIKEDFGHLLRAKLGQRRSLVGVSVHRPQYPLPHRIPVQVASLKHGIRPHGGTDRRVLAVALHEDVGGA